MGRWGYRLFEGDLDLDIACDLKNAFGEGKNKLELSPMIHQSDMIAPHEARIYYQTAAYQEDLKRTVEKTRKKLDAGASQKLFDKYRPLEEEYNGELRVILIGALIMRAGAKLSEENKNHLRELAAKFPGREGYQMPISDDGLRGPGKAQFLTALDNYKEGTPRRFDEPCCFKCGKMEVDTRKAPKKCGRCKRAWYCGTECQKAHWAGHKSTCIDPKDRFSLNV